MNKLRGGSGTVTGELVILRKVDGVVEVVPFIGTVIVPEQEHDNGSDTHDGGAQRDCESGR